MALGDHMASHFSQSSASVLSHLDDFSGREEGDVSGQRRELDAVAGVNQATVSSTSMVYLPQTVFLCDSRHEGFEECVPIRPSESGLVSKWRPKDRNLDVSATEEAVTKADIKGDIKDDQYKRVPMKC